jgi:hypothetical protein
LQVAAIVVPAVVGQVHLLEPAHPFIRILLLVGVGLALMYRGPGPAGGCWPAAR